MRTLILNSTNVVSGTNYSQYSYNFPNGGITLQEDDEIAIQSIMMPYSNFNVSSNLNNNYFQYQIGSNVFTVNLGNMFATITDINNALQQAFITNGHYLKDNQGNYVFYITLQINLQKYAYEIDTYPIPSTLPSGYTNPANVFYNTIIPTGVTPQIIIPSSNNFGTLIGFTAGSYPATPQSILTSSLSNITPNITPVNSYVLRCNAVYNKYSIPPDTFFAFSPQNVSFGSNIVINPTVVGWVSARAGAYYNLIITICDQNFNQIAFNDYNVCIQILIRNKNEK